MRESPSRQRIEISLILEFPVQLAPEAVGTNRLDEARERLSRTGRRDEALKYFTAAMDTPLLEWATIETSRELLEAGRFDEARDFLDKAIKRDPDRLSWRLQQGYNARSMDDHKAAHAAFAVAATLSPGRAEAQVEFAIEEFHHGRPSQAVERLMAVIERHPGQSQAVGTLANFAEQFDDFEAAVTLLQRCAQLNPSDLGVRLRLAEGLTKLGRNVEADDVLAALAGQFGSTPDLHIVRARILSSRGDYKAAREILAEGAGLFPSVFELWFQHVTSLIACGDYDAARRNLKSAPLCSALEQTRVRLLHGEVAAAEWRLDAALSHYTEGLKFSPNDAWLSNCAARVALPHGRYGSGALNRPGFGGGSNFQIGWSHDEQDDEQIFH